MREYSENDEDILSRGIEAQNEELAAAKARIAELEKENYRLRDYCGASARDYKAVANTLAAHGLPFPRTIKEAHETASFLDAASAGSDDVTAYDGCLSQAMDRIAELEKERDEAYRALLRVSGFDRADFHLVGHVWEKARRVVEAEKRKEAREG